MDDIIKALENFICSGDLEQLEEHYNHFNIFDCVGMSKQEIRHSNFLSWLFNPKENHGMEDFFVKEFLKKVISENSTKTSDLYELPTVFDVDSWDMSNLLVLRENDNIDIKLFNNSEQFKFICVIENKIESKQGKYQLEKYFNKIINNPEYNEYKKLFLYLKPQKNEEINKEYIYVAYDTIVTLLEERILPKKKDYISQSLILVIEKYIELLRRDIMNDEKIKQICERIYSCHRKAIDTIIDNVDTGQNECQIAVARLINTAIGENNKYKHLGGKDNYRNISFIPKDFSQYEDCFKFRIWNAVMKGEFSLKIDFLKDDLNIQQQICNACNKAIIKTQKNTVIGTILNRKECEKLCKNYEDNQELTKEWEEKILNKIKSILSIVNYDALKNIH